METLMKMKWKIGSVEIENPFILAPMAGVTDLPFRILCKEQGAGLLCTEMVSAKAISFHNKNTISLIWRFYFQRRSDTYCYQKESRQRTIYTQRW